MNIDQELFLEGEFGSLLDGSFSYPYKLQSVGLRLGMELSGQNERGFGFYARTSLSPLIGKFASSGNVDINLDFPGFSFSSNPPFEVRKSFTQVIPVVDAAVGLSWNRGPFTVIAGYEILTMFNTSGRILDTGGASGLAMDGAFLRLRFER